MVTSSSVFVHATLSLHCVHDAIFCPKFEFDDVVCVILAVRVLVWIPSVLVVVADSKSNGISD